MYVYIYYSVRVYMYMYIFIIFLLVPTQHLIKIFFMLMYIRYDFVYKKKSILRKEKSRKSLTFFHFAAISENRVFHIYFPVLLSDQIK